MGLSGNQLFLGDEPLWIAEGLHVLRRPLPPEGDWRHYGLGARAFLQRRSWFDPIRWDTAL